MLGHGLYYSKYYNQIESRWVLEKEFSEVFAEFYVNFEAAKHLHPSMTMAIRFIKGLLCLVLPTILFNSDEG
ncbi:MAG: hypothetical protein WCF07_05690 [Nitrososphaeraceae archaeon]